MSEYHLDFILDGLPPMNSADGTHWRVRRRMRVDWEWRVLTKARPKPIEPLPKARVTITRYSSREPDFENLAQGGKFLLDGLVKARIILDDKPSVIGQPEYRWEKVGPRKGKVRVQVWSGVEIGERVKAG